MIWPQSWATVNFFAQTRPAAAVDLDFRDHRDDGAVALRVGNAAPDHQVALAAVRIGAACQRARSATAFTTPA